eukprot:PhM_4_TR7619/c0_g1_i1/m.3447
MLWCCVVSTISGKLTLHVDVDACPSEAEVASLMLVCPTRLVLSNCNSEIYGRPFGDHSVVLLAVPCCEEQTSGFNQSITPHYADAIISHFLSLATLLVPSARHCDRGGLSVLEPYVRLVLEAMRAPTSSSSSALHSLMCQWLLAPPKCVHPTTLPCVVAANGISSSVLDVVAAAGVAATTSKLYLAAMAKAVNLITAEIPLRSKEDALALLCDDLGGLEATAAALYLEQHTVGVIAIDSAVDLYFQLKPSIYTLASTVMTLSLPSSSSLSSASTSQHSVEIGCGGDDTGGIQKVFVCRLKDDGCWLVVATADPTLSLSRVREAAVGRFGVVDPDDLKAPIITSSPLSSPSQQSSAPEVLMVLGLVTTHKEGVDCATLLGVDEMLFVHTPTSARRRNATAPRALSRLIASHRRALMALDASDPVGCAAFLPPHDSHGDDNDDVDGVDIVWVRTSDAMIYFVLRGDVMGFDAEAVFSSVKTSATLMLATLAKGVLPRYVAAWKQHRKTLKNKNK